MKLSIYEGYGIYDSAINMLRSIDKSDLDVDNIVIVPDKYSLLTEKTLLDIFPEGSLFNVRVKTLSSIAVEILQKLSIDGGEIISSGESLLLTAQAIENVKNNFKTFKKCNINFCHEINKLISQFKSSLVFPENLNDKAEGVVGNKYYDLALIYAEYQRLLNGKMDANQRLSLLKDKLSRSGVLANTKFYFAHFDSFTKEGFSVVETFLEEAKEVCISVVKPLSIGNEYIYEKDILQKLKKFLNEKGGQLCVYSNQNLKSKQEEAIVRGVYSYERTSCRNDGYYNLYGALGVSQEIESVAKLIRYSVYHGNRYRDIQIAVGGLEKYQGQIENIFDRYNIPFYIDSSVCADKTILGNFVLSFFYTYLTGFAKESLIDLFGNALLKEERLVQICQNFDVDGRGRYKKYIEKEFSCAHLFEAIDNASSCENFGKVVLKLCDYVEEKYQQMLLSMEEKSLLKERNINIQVKDIIVECVGLLNKYSYGELDAGEYYKRLKLLLSFKQVSTVPTYVDAVMIGDATQSAFEDKPTLCIIGGENLPISSSDNGILTDDDLKLNQTEFEIEPTIRMINRRNRFKLFNLLMRAEKNLFVFYQLVGEEGKKNELPTFVKSLNGIFSQESLMCGNVFFSSKPSSKQQALLSSALQEKKSNFENLSRDVLIESGEDLMLAGSRVKVTQIENYFLCPFKHFATYGLKLKENSPFFDQRDTGTVCHKMAEIFVRELIKGRTPDVKDFVDKNIYKVLESEGALEKIQNMEEGKSLIGFLKKQMNSLLNDILKEQEKSSFKPKYNEMKFDNLVLGGRYKLIGMADRIDKFGDYLRVVDYKTGKTGNILKQLYFGEKLQLFLYQKIICQRFGAKEGGVFYFNAKFDYSKGDDFIILKGLVDDCDEVIEAVDADLIEKGKSSIAQISKGSKGYKGATVSPYPLHELCEYAVNVAEKASEEIAHGYIVPKPSTEGCEYCPYRALCQHEDCDGNRNTEGEIKF